MKNKIILILTLSVFIHCFQKERTLNPIYTNTELNTNKELKQTKN
ncbi:MAG TPA: hypothetical protein PK079_18680 [Leptospiraceae bacterium]|nr:hypothetical protein [Leptospiraceae bacterium]HMW08511.1 hypothetical protein [Leptospiraceae bacterium]HMX31958.1 hypothetical protein [Leptospiraceae bacterium]HMY34343.1 hypothetical protein [Leptospiraceae bacterium]HMZ66461.1 hypothetical protein [Leptospiraceae bacterium]